ncbi:peptidoglycan editing factor PgeF [Fictibacillus phosphorivorans]|uniref:peptidoglycan editing factor PgeF n=1 Tax=Fictibacillus phosphorivorans TaxID=1221500 RepID=UPI00204061D1|nr:peptidoglycan editing factor PgeF [Fictibacillus phosphorivorans]MCM3717240.1 peptidoglycan editing factor PgeF [Fictibacillus phosphorivorans]MCM3774927.1 peptidoglycan editing factor PgeF [Fictibacillus phosphorivorans]
MKTFKQTGKYLLIEEWRKENPLITAGFTMRDGGYSPMPFCSLNMGFHVNDDPRYVQDNRKMFADEINFPITNWVGSKQVHGTKIVRVTEKDRGRGSLDFDSAIPDVDGLYTELRDILLTSLYADCVPLYFYSPKNNLIGLAHAGWRGTVGKIGPKMVEIWCEREKADLHEIKAAIGPAIGECCYEVDEKVIREVKTALNKEENPDVFTAKHNGRYQLNLQKLNESLLLEAGLLPKNIITSTQCTSCENSLFFSHRKDNGKTGRMMSFIGWKGVK